MATTNNVFVNVKDLPEVQQINNGDYILVETPNGTSILDFQNFIIGTDNNGLTVAVESNSSDIVAVSAAASAEIAALSAEIYTNLSRVYYGTAQIVLDDGVDGIAVLSPRPPAEVGDIFIEDIIIMPGNADATRYGAFATLVENTDSNRGIVHITGVFDKTIHTLTGAITIPLTNNNPVGLPPMSSTFTAQELTTFIEATVGDIGDGSNTLSVTTTVEDSSPRNLNVTAVYNIIVMKAY